MHGIGHLVYASSSSVYGANDKLPFSITDRVDAPKSLYAATKRADELMSVCYNSLFGLPMTGLRFFTVYGPWGRPDMAVWLFTEAILRGEPIRVVRAPIERDFTYIDDIVAGVVAALDRPPRDAAGRGEHRVYNLGNTRREALLTLVDVIEAACGRPALREWMEMPPGDVGTDGVRGRANTPADDGRDRAAPRPGRGPVFRRRRRPAAS
jgi:UDP-glucuronate 4-epimerase